MTLEPFFRSVLLVCVLRSLTSAPISVVAQDAQQDQQIPPKFDVGPIPQSILDVKTKGDFIYDTVHTIAPELEGYDDVLLEEDLGIAYATGRDGWIWKVDLKTGKAERFVDVPVMAAGLHRIGIGCPVVAAGGRLV